MKVYLYPGLTLALCAVSFWLLLRDIDANGLGEITEQNKAKRLAYVFSGIMLLLTEGVAVMYLTVYEDFTVWTAVKRLALLSVMWPVALIDYKTYRIPNSYIIYGLACRVLIFPFELIFSEPGVWQVLLGEVIAAAAMLLAAVLCGVLIKNSVGFGDMKLFVVMGLLLGTQGIWSAVFLSLIVSFIAAVFLLATKRKTKKDAIPFGPALVLGTYLAAYLTGM